MFDLPADEIFIGMGVHGEPGMARRKIGPVQGLVAQMMEAIAEDMELEAGAEVIPFVNGAGGTSLMELLIVYRELDSWLAARSISTFAPLVAELVTTQDMGGVSISLLRPDDSIKRLWLKPCAAPYFPDTGAGLRSNTGSEQS